MVGVGEYFEQKNLWMNSMESCGKCEALDCLLCQWFSGIAKYDEEGTDRV